MCIFAAHPTNLYSSHRTLVKLISMSGILTMRMTSKLQTWSRLVLVYFTRYVLHSGFPKGIHCQAFFRATTRIVFFTAKTKRIARVRYKQVSRPGFQPAGQVFCRDATCAGRCVVATKRKVQSTPGLIKTKKERKTNPVPDGFVEWEQNVIAESVSRDIDSNPFDYINLVSVETLSNVLCSRFPWLTKFVSRRSVNPAVRRNLDRCTRRQHASVRFLCLIWRYVQAIDLRKKAVDLCI